jgi:pyrimidine-nucleoside phosphorylase
MEPLEVIAAKRDGHELDSAALSDFVLAFARDELPDYQMAAFLMAGFVRGFTPAETAAMTAAMVASGDTLDLSALSGPTVDKHSTGGVGDGTTLVVAPLAAELGLQVVKLSGRGLGHTGGTLDKLESIPGLRVDLTAAEVLAQVERIGLAVSAQTADLVPADRAIYALRDVTATVGNVPLIAASVMSKKLAGGARTILLDVKTGSGAFMKDLDGARELAAACVRLGEEAGRTTGALITDMSQPLSEMIGNAIEVREVIEVLRGERRGRFSELCVRLAGCLAWFAGVAESEQDGVARAQAVLDSGAALERFGAFVAAQGGDRAIIDEPSLLPQAPVVRDVLADGAGWLAAVDAERVGLAASGLGAGRRRKDDDIDPAVGIELTAKIGDRIESGQAIGRVHARSAEAAGAAEARLRQAIVVADRRCDAPPLVHELIRPAARPGR